MSKPKPIGFVRAKAGEAQFECLLRNGSTQIFNLAKGVAPLDIQDEPVYFLGYSNADFIVIYGDPLVPDYLSTGNFQGEWIDQLYKALGFNSAGFVAIANKEGEP